MTELTQEIDPVAAIAAGLDLAVFEESLHPRLHGKFTKKNIGEVWKGLGGGGHYKITDVKDDGTVHVQQLRTTPGQEHHNPSDEPVSGTPHVIAPSMVDKALSHKLEPHTPSANSPSNTSKVADALKKQHGGGRAERFRPPEPVQSAPTAAKSTSTPPSPTRAATSGHPGSPGRGPSGKVRNFRAMNDAKFDAESWKVIQHAHSGAKIDHDSLDAIHAEALARFKKTGDGKHEDIADAIDQVRNAGTYGKPHSLTPVTPRPVAPRPAPVLRPAPQHGFPSRPSYSHVGRSGAGRLRNYKAMSDAKFAALLPQVESHADHEVHGAVLKEAQRRGLR